MKRVVRTESAELPSNTLRSGDPVWLFELDHGRRREHLARVERVNADGTLDLSFQITGENGRNAMESVPQVRSDAQCTAWTRAK